MKRQSQPRHISILHRLRNRAKDENLPPKSILPYYGMECFLHRLSNSKYRSKFILKGGLIFNALNIPDRRSTRDIDFRGFVDNDVDTVVQIVKEICSIPVEEDGVEFDTDSMKAEQIMLDTNYEGVRIRLIAYLGKARINLQLDFSFVEVINPEVVALEYPTLLETPSINILGYPLETVIAEKLETMVRRSEFNSRQKDFYDLWLLSKTSSFSGSILLEAITETFEYRGTAIPKGTITALSEDFARQFQKDWSVFVDREGLLDPDLDDLSVELADIRLFLLPALQAASRADAFETAWIPGGPWS